MEKLLTAPVSSQGQVTLPKSIREALGITKEGDIVHFLMRGDQVVLTKGFFVAPANLEFTEKELKQLQFKAKKSGTKSFRTPQAAIRFLDTL